MKRILAVLLSAMLVFSFAACSDKENTPKNEPVEEISSDAEQDVEEADEENTVVEEEGSVPGESAQSSETLTVSGKVTDIAEDKDSVKITLETEDGETLELSSNDETDFTEVGEILADDSLQVTYIQNEDGSNIIVKVVSVS